jgi:predicted porin
MFGIRGSEPLGGGVNAIFQVESKLFLDTGGGILAGRESFLGFQSPWGTVKLGFFLSPYDDIHRSSERADAPTSICRPGAGAGVSGSGAAGVRRPPRDSVR